MYVAPRLTTIGIDEAGRGPAIGPLVMAAVALDTVAARTLTRAGLVDSKDFVGPKARDARLAMADRIRKLASFIVVEEIEVHVIDPRVMVRELNQLQREAALRMLAGAPYADRIIADGARMFGPLCAVVPRFEAMDGAESEHAAVAAASVIAKTIRDQRMSAICDLYRAEFGEITGGGYVNDGTRRFLRAYAERHRCLPPEARRSWPHPYLEGLLDDPTLIAGSQAVSDIGIDDEAAAEI